MRIPFHRPSLRGGEHDHVARALAGSRLAGDGELGRRCERILESAVGTRRALLTTSCTHALELCALLLDLEHGDEVIVPSFTFTSTANAFALRGARPVFADVRPDTLNLDESRLEALITARTRAIVVVHYAGVGCEMDAIAELAGAHGLEVIEDNAHGLFASYRGRQLGTLGALATQSFHDTKNFTCGEGGALLINDDRHATRAEILREKGTDRSRFFRGEVDRYTWQDLGSSYVLSEILAAVLLGQLESRAEIQASRRRIWERYLAELATWAARVGATLPVVPPHCESAHHLFHVLLPDLERRDALLAHLRARGVQAVFHYLPLHCSPMGLRLGGRPGSCPVTESVSERLVRLPFFTDMADDEQRIVIDAVTSFQ
jgi:dTDP-4-amino-4,6-dideoxygalactose transaminase